MAAIMLVLPGLICHHARGAGDVKVAPADVPKLLQVFVSEFVAITPGKGKFPKSFQMGTNDGPQHEGPAREVTLSHDFSMAKYEVPQDLYLAVMGSNPSRWTGPRNSVEMMTVGEAGQFCQKITELLRAQKLIGSDEEVRLPTEAEWEYCCRAGSKTKYSFGDKARADGDTEKKATILGEYGWHTGNAAGNDPPVGALKPNAWGLYDMHGYLWEFVQDVWPSDSKNAPADGSARRTGLKNAGVVARGGSWRETFEELSSTARRQTAVDFKRDDVGFRCVRARVEDSKAKVKE